MDLLTSADHAFFSFVSEMGRSYGTRSEYEFRQNIFKENLTFIEEWNANEKNTHTVGINYMSDWTHDEVKIRNGFKPSKQEKIYADFSHVDVSSLPKTWDWRN